jgi:hypothetical protein
MDRQVKSEMSCTLEARSYYYFASCGKWQPTSPTHIYHLKKIKFSETTLSLPLELQETILCLQLHSKYWNQRATFTLRIYTPFLLEAKKCD